MNMITVYLSTPSTSRQAFTIPAGTTLGPLLSDSRVGVGYNANQSYRVNGENATSNTVLNNGDEIVAGIPKKVAGA